MTEVFIAAVSTTKFQLNEQDLQFYRDEKAREIQDVRLAMEQLYQFNQLSKKERTLANHALLWKNLLILSKILGYQADFAIIHQLRIPESILTQAIWSLNELFLIKHYCPRSSIGNWQTNADKYYILLSGIVEREVLRSSISKFEGDALQLSQQKITGGSKWRRNNRKRLARTDEQIPICLNSKRSQSRNAQGAGANFRSLTNVEMFEVNCYSWKRYVSDFKRLQEEYLMNFIRKKLNISLNWAQKQQPTEKAQSQKQDPFYCVITLEKKASIQFSQLEICLLYMGEMLLTTQNYKVEISRGCLLNPAAFKLFNQHHNQPTPMSGTATAKSLSTIIKISINRLSEYFNHVPQEKSGFVELLKGLEINRKNKNEEEIFALLPRAESLGNLKQSYMKTKLMSSQAAPESTFRPISQSPGKLKQKSVKGKSSEKLCGLKNIEHMVEKTARAAQLKHIQYLKKAHLSEDPNTKLYQEDNQLGLPQSLFKDCMRNIETKNELLKHAVRVQREKIKNQIYRRQNIMNAHPPNEASSKGKAAKTHQTDGSVFLKRRIKDIYVKTEGCENIINFASSDRPATSAAITAKTSTRQTVGSSHKLHNFSQTQLYSGHSKWYSGGLAVMKKVQTGKIRRIKIKQV